MRFAFLLVASALAGCGSGNASPVALNPTVACAERGTAYFRKIRSYPTLHSAPNIGRSAEEVALERCTLNLSAF